MKIIILMAALSETGSFPKAIEDAYKGFMMQHKFPFVSLHIQMEGNDLDVNVHPRKMEVRFARGTEVYDAVYETVRKALTTREMIPDGSVWKRRNIRNNLCGIFCCKTRRCAGTF